MAEFRMPALGADMEAGVLVAWRRKPGERLERGDVIAEVETDKGIIEVEVFSGGVLERYLVDAGQRVPVGTPLAILVEAPGTTSVAPPVSEPSAPVAVARAPEPRAKLDAAPAPEPRPQPTAADPIAAPPSIRRRARELGLDLGEVLAQAHRPTLGDLDAARRAPGAEPPRADHPRSSPAARKRALELGLDLRQIHGTGPEGAIVLDDIERAGAAKPAVPQATPGVSPPEDSRSALRRAIATAMTRSKREIPHYYLTTTIDLARMTGWLAQYNLERSVRERIVSGALLLKAVARAAKELPDFNCLWQDGGPRAMPDVHLGVAVALRGGGLVAPAIHRADTLTLSELMAKLQDLVTRARSGSLRSSELSDGTLTVTSLGERGVESVLPIIYAPQTAIVGFGRIAERPWVSDSALVVRPLVTASLAADHRVTDGHLGARFLNRVDQLLQEPEKL